MTCYEMPRKDRSTEHISCPLGEDARDRIHKLKGVKSGRKSKDAHNLDNGNARSQNRPGQRKIRQWSCMKRDSVTGLIDGVVRKKQRGGFQATSIPHQAENWRRVATFVCS